MKIIKLEKKLNFDVAIVSFPSQTNLTNFLLINVLNKLKPKLVARVTFDELPITIINRGQFQSPSVDFYYKRIGKKTYCFGIANYKPRDSEAYKKIYGLLKKSNELVILNETREGEESFYVRKEHRRQRKRKEALINVEKIKEKFKQLDNAIIRGIPVFVFDQARKEKKNITVLFFNTNKGFEDNFQIFNESFSLDEGEKHNKHNKLKLNEKMLEQNEKLKKPEIKKEKHKWHYIG
ncbi:MAG: hypothetical protein QXE64_01675 [Candidatus Pacearchaeota archaeon]